MIPNIEIRLYLVDRYINGYKLNDPFYLKIKNILIKKIKNITTNNTLQKQLSNYIGNFDYITANIYKDLATEYLIKHKKISPSLSDIFNII